MKKIAKNQGFRLENKYIIYLCHKPCNQREQKEKIFAYVSYNYIIKYINYQLVFMRLSVIYILILCTIFGANSVYWMDYKSTINSWNPVQANSQNNIKQSELIEKYLINYKSTIKDLEEKYDIQNSRIIKENVSELNLMIQGLRKIQTESVEKQDAAEVIKSVVDGLKIVNNNLKPYLKVKQREYDNKIDTLRIKYTAPAKRMSGQINTLIKRIATPMKSQSRLTLNQKQILKYLIQLEEESNKLNNFWNRSFDTTSEVTDYLKSILRNVRDILTNIKGLL